KANPTLSKLLGGAGTDAANKAIILAMANKLTIVFVVVATIPALLTILRLNNDEKKGYLELQHAAPISRLRLFTSFAGHGLVVGSLSFLLALLGMIIAGASSATVTISAAHYLRGFIGFWPALLVVCSIGALLVGFLPRLQSLVWILPVYGVISLYLGPLLDFPTWATRLTPYGWVNEVPVKAIQ
ncbi:hypothetical protein ACFQ5D_24665, partial [Paenibacillus farraposensis]